MAPSGLRRGFRVGSPPAKFDHSQFEYNGRLLRTMSHESRFFRHGFFSDSDAAFRRDRLRMVLRPRITGHKFRLYPGFRRARHVRAPTNRIQAIKIMQLIAAVVGASAWEARQRYLTTAQSSIMAGFYERRTATGGAVTPRFDERPTMNGFTPPYNRN